MNFSVVVIAVCLLPGCHSISECCRKCFVSTELDQRMGHTLGDTACAGDISIPPGVNLEDGLTEDEAITLALWNNAAYLEMLSELGISRAQLLEAGLLTDPQMILLFPLGPKQLEFMIFQAVDEIWLRKIRVRAAELDLSRVADQMIQNGLNLIRDVRIAHADLLLAQESRSLAIEAHKLRSDIADLAKKRLDAGDISELEETTSEIDALQAKADAERSEQDVELAETRLKTLMGLTLQSETIVAVNEPPGHIETISPDELVQEALAVRPDLRAAEIAIESANQNRSLFKWPFTEFEMGYDANGEGFDGFESGPSLRLRLPIFNANRGRKAIAEAQLERVTRNYITIRDQIVLDVETSAAQLAQASQNLATVQDEILPKLDEAVQLAKTHYLDGGTSYFLVLQTTGQFLDARAREIALAADLRRSIAELDRSVGHRVVTIDYSDDELKAPSAEITSTNLEVKELSIPNETTDRSGWQPFGTRNIDRTEIEQVESRLKDDEYTVEVTQ